MKRAGKADLALWRCLLLCFCAGCATWQVESASPQRLITEERPRSVLVTLKDSSKVLIANPVIRRDSITGVIRLQPVGFVPEPYHQDLLVGVALADVAFVSVAKVDAGRTLMWLIPAGVVIVVLAVLAS